MCVLVVIYGQYSFPWMLAQCALLLFHGSFEACSEMEKWKCEIMLYFRSVSKQMFTRVINLEKNFVKPQLLTNFVNEILDLYH